MIVAGGFVETQNNTTSTAHINHMGCHCQTNKHKQTKIIKQQ